MINYIQILLKNYPNTNWSFDGDSYDGLTWQDSSPKPTQAELEALAIPTETAVAKANCKSKAKELLVASDWSVLSDINIINSAEFIAYRALLRELVINPVTDPTYPTEPKPVWG